MAFSAEWSEPRKFHFHHEGVLGTSFDLVVRTHDATMAVRAEEAALAETERLRKVLSTYDPTSEASRLNATGNLSNCPPDLMSVLDLYESWRVSSSGAYNGQLGELVSLWRRAERMGVPPNESELGEIVRTISGSGWSVSADKAVLRLNAQPLNLDSLGKGYIIHRAAAAARAALPSTAALLLNIGGDIFASGDGTLSNSWVVGITNPKEPADNAVPLTHVRLAERAISTSASYERGYTVAGRRYSHILDPRTGYPAQGIASATVVANDNPTANALATTLCVLKPEEGLALIEETAGAECLIVADDGQQFRSAGFAAIEVPATGPAKKANESKPSLWPKDFQATLTFALKTPKPGGRGGYRRPYVAIWVDDEKGKRVRTIAVWGNNENYFPDLHDWYYGEKDRPQWALSIARATRPAGRHRVVWDGRDDSGNPLPLGTYTIVLEANREHGAYAKQRGKIVCGAETASGLIKASSEFEEGQLAYGPPSAE